MRGNKLYKSGVLGNLKYLFGGAGNSLPEAKLHCCSNDSLGYVKSCKCTLFEFKVHRCTLIQVYTRIRYTWLQRASNVDSNEIQHTARTTNLHSKIQFTGLSVQHFTPYQILRSLSEDKCTLGKHRVDYPKSISLLTKVYLDHTIIYVKYSTLHSD